MGWFDERFEAQEGRLRYDCVVCGRHMWFPRSKHGKYITCGGECSEKRRNKGAALRERPCETCGSKFVPRATQIASGRGRFCSQKCNRAGQAALNSPEAQARSHQSWKRRHALLPIVKSGPENPGWTGGRAATYQRLKQSGKTRIYYMNRKARDGFQRASPEIVQTLGRLQRWRCAVCAVKLVKYEVDHIVPLAKGGTNQDSNLQLLCVSCNRTKQAIDPIEFMQRRGFLL